MFEGVVHCTWPRRVLAKWRSNPTQSNSIQYNLLHVNAPTIWSFPYKNIFKSPLSQPPQLNLSCPPVLPASVETWQVGSNSCCCTGRRGSGAECGEARTCTAVTGRLGSSRLGAWRGLVLWGVAWPVMEWTVCRGGLGPSQQILAIDSDSLPPLVLRSDSPPPLPLLPPCPSALPEPPPSPSLWPRRGFSTGSTSIGTTGSHRNSCSAPASCR